MPWTAHARSYDCALTRQGGFRIEPKKARLKKAEQMVKENLKQLELRRRILQVSVERSMPATARERHLQEVTERLQALSDQFSQMSQKKQDLQSQITACEQKVGRAVRLLTALGERGLRANGRVHCKRRLA